MVTLSSMGQTSHSGRKGAVVVDGLDAVVGSFIREAVTVGPKAGAVAVRSADKAAQRMRNTVPIGPPDLHVLNSITSDQTPHIQGGAVYADAGPDPRADEGAFVARFLEYGTVKQAPRPFMGPAADQTFPEFVDTVKRLPSL